MIESILSQLETILNGIDGQKLRTSLRKQASSIGTEYSRYHFLELCRLGCYEECIKEIAKTAKPIDTDIIYSYYICNCELYIWGNHIYEDYLTEFMLTGIVHHDIILLRNDPISLVDNEYEHWPIQQLPPIFDDEVDPPYFYFHYSDPFPNDPEFGMLLVEKLGNTLDDNYLDYIYLLISWIWRLPSENWEASERILNRIVELLPDCSYAQKVLIHSGYKEGSLLAPSYITRALSMHPHRWFDILRQYTNTQKEPLVMKRLFWKIPMVKDEVYENLPWTVKLRRFFAWLAPRFVCYFNVSLELAKVARKQDIYSELRGRRPLNSNAILEVIGFKK